ncbi:hypothetical protein GMMP1_630035 [Candidatus Magnetomoraceae bacterium gMMP-1]
MAKHELVQEQRKLFDVFAKLANEYIRAEKNAERNFNLKCSDNKSFFEPEIMYVTANLNVNYIHPTPMDSEIILRSHILEMSGRKAIVACSLYADDKECANGKVTAVRVSVDKLKAK